MSVSDRLLRRRIGMLAFALGLWWVGRTFNPYTLPNQPYTRDTSAAALVDMLHVPESQALGYMLMLTLLVLPSNIIGALYLYQLVQAFLGEGQIFLKHNLTFLAALGGISGLMMTLMEHYAMFSADENDIWLTVRLYNLFTSWGTLILIVVGLGLAWHIWSEVRLPLFLRRSLLPLACLSLIAQLLIMGRQGVAVLLPIQLVLMAALLILPGAYLWMSALTPLDETATPANRTPPHHTRPNQ